MSEDDRTDDSLFVCFGGKQIFLQRCCFEFFFLCKAAVASRIVRQCFGNIFLSLPLHLNWTSQSSFRRSTSLLEILSERFLKETKRVNLYFVFMPIFFVVNNLKN